MCYDRGESRPRLKGWSDLQNRVGVALACFSRFLVFQLRCILLFAAAAEIKRNGENDID